MKVLPAFQAIPHLVGLMILRSESADRHVIAMSLWDGDLQDSEGLMSGFRRRLHDLAGAAPSTEPYEVLGGRSGGHGLRFGFG